MRRLIIEEPVSRAALWGRRIAWFSLPVLLSGVLLTRSGGDNLTPGLAVIGAAFLLALMALQFAVIAFIQIWRKGRRGLGYGVSALVVSLLVLGFPAALGARLFMVPYYADLSTDSVRPPAFSRSTIALAARGGLVPHASGDNILAGMTGGELWQHAPEVQKFIQGLPVPASDRATLRQMQRLFHPNLASVSTEMPVAAAFARAKMAAQKEGWTIVDALPPGGRLGIGHLDAVKYSRILKLPIDVTVRLRPHADGTTVDVRTIPRYRLFDVGSGPRHIEQYLGYFSPDGLSGS